MMKQRAIKIGQIGTSLVQWLRLWPPNAGGTVSIPGQGTKPHMPHGMVKKENKNNNNNNNRGCLYLVLVHKI